MASNPCSMCGERFVGSAITGYHRWYDGSARVGYKQKICFKCAKISYGPIQAGAIDTNTEDPTYPSACPTCQTPLDGQIAETWTTWYRANNKLSTVLIQCPHCAGNTRQMMVAGAERLEDREPSGVGAGGAPLPNPTGFGSKDDLPW